MPEPLSYDEVGATRPAETEWPDTPPRFRRHEETVRLGRGDAVWADSAHLVMRWAVKQRSGFSTTRPTVGLGDVILRAKVGPFSVHEPVRVVAVVDRPDRVGFAYGTRHGHPVCGEEAFVVTRDPEGNVDLVLRSLTAPAPRPPWRSLYPLTLVAQRFFRRRYRRALIPEFDREQRARRRRRGLLSAALTLVLVVLGVVGERRPGGYVLVAVLLDHVFWFGVVGALLAGTAFRTLVRRPAWVGAAGLGVAIVVAVVWAAFGWFVSLFGVMGTSTIDEPGRPYEIRVVTVADVIDPAYEIWVREPNGLLTREWRVACLGEGSDPTPVLRSARWSADGRLSSPLYGRSLRIAVDPASGEPRSVNEPWRC